MQPEDQSCCRCDKDTGGCINSSPAGKRRIAAGADQQLDDDFANAADERLTSAGVFSHVGSPLTAITAIAIAACLLVVTIFVIIFAVLQRTTTSNSHGRIKYNKLASLRRRSGRTTLKVTAVDGAQGDDLDDDEVDLLSANAHYSDGTDSDNSDGGRALNSSGRRPTEKSRKPGRRNKRLSAKEDDDSVNITLFT